MQAHVEGNCEECSFHLPSTRSSSARVSSSAAQTTSSATMPEQVRAIKSGRGLLKDSCRIYIYN
jgi:hypothetical protein